MSKYMRVSRSFSTDINGVPTMYNEGQIVRGDDPAVKGRDDFFEDIEKHAARTTGAVETATSAPGERRSITRALTAKAQKRADRKPAANQTGDEAKPDTSTPRNPAPDATSTTTGKVTK